MRSSVTDGVNFYRRAKANSGVSANPPVPENEYKISSPNAISTKTKNNVRDEI